ncbi:MAG: ABC transporter permease [Eubacterium sp.]|nr:ABC transporter permease [Eubacterium sp.]
MKALKDLYEYRQMVYSLVRKELRGKYKGSVLGFAWTFINPLLQLFVYTLVFSVIMRASIENYYIFLFVALVPWMFFQSSVVGGSSSILDASDMVKKIYFPREVLPIAYVTSAFVNMALTFLVVFAVLAVSGFGISLRSLLCLPVVMLIEYILAVGFALLSSAFSVYVRDLVYVLNIVTMAWQYLTPVMYSEEMIPKDLLPIWNLNPMTPIISAYRSILYYQKMPQLSTLWQALVLGILCVAAGYLVFRRLQRGFAEEL